MRFARASLLPCLSMLLLMACPATTTSGPPGLSSSSSSSGGGGGSFDAGVVTNTCVRDQECAPGLVCSGTDAGCVAGLACDPQGALCGECDVGGTRNCGFPDGPAYCDSTALTCRRPLGSCGPCTADDQCGENEQLGVTNKCLDYGGSGYCGLACTTTCSEGFECSGAGCRVANNVGTCIGALTCYADVDCPTGKHCTTYQASPPRLGVCLKFCLDDDECPHGKICQTSVSPTFGQCIQGCAPGSEVNGGQICHEWGRYGPTCPATACPTGYECSNATSGYCKQGGCDNDSECPLSRTMCNVATRECVDGCNDDTDCGAFETCVNAVCVEPGCRGKDLSCNLGQFCCGTELYAPGGEACPSGVTTGDCFPMADPFCRHCTDEDGCADIHNFDVASHCYELQRQAADGGTQSIGKFCSVGCRTSADCPRGMTCDDLPAGDNGETVKGCLSNMCANFGGGG